MPESDIFLDESLNMKIIQLRINIKESLSYICTSIELVQRKKKLTCDRITDPWKIYYFVQLHD